jgi:hypothetical protein
LLRWFDVCFGFKVRVEDGAMDVTKCGAKLLALAWHVA